MTAMPPLLRLLLALALTISAALPAAAGDPVSLSPAARTVTPDQQSPTPVAPHPGAGPTRSAAFDYIAPPTETELPPPPGPSVTGFAKSVPMTLALRRLAPPSVTVSYARGVDPSRPISWDAGAGRPWYQVLRDALAAAGYAARLEPGNKLFVEPALGGPATSPLPTAPRSRSRTDVPAPNFASLAAVIPAAPSVSPVVAAAPSSQPTSPLAPLPPPPLFAADHSSPCNPSPDLVTVRRWSIPLGTDLYALLSGWAREARLSSPGVIWEVPFAYRAEVAASVTGTLLEAVRFAVEGFHAADPPPDWRYNPYTCILRIVPLS